MVGIRGLRETRARSSSHDEDFEAARLVLLKLHCGPGGPEVALVEREVVVGRLLLANGLQRRNVDLPRGGDLAALPLEAGVSVPES
jgi:hypothetical protein